VDSLECLDNLVCLLQDNLECREILAWQYLLAQVVTPVTQPCLQDNLVCLGSLLLEEPLIVHNLPVLQEQHVKRQRLENNVSKFKKLEAFKVLLCKSLRGC
jgi:hypothetical protein